MTITKFDTTACRVIGREIEEAVQAIAKKHGISITLGRGTFTDTTFGIKLEAATISASGEINDKFTAAFTQWADLIGMKREWLHQPFTIAGKAYVLRGYLPNGVKFQIVGEHNGQRYKLPVDAVRKAFQATT